MCRKSRCISIILIFVMCFSMAGCTTTGSSDAQRTRNEGTAVGVGAGALLGGLTGAFIDDDSKGGLIGAGIGAAAGGVVGYAYGDHVASQKAKYVSEEDWLDQCIASARHVNQETLVYNNQLRTDIAQLDAKTKALEKKYTAGQVSKKVLLAEKKRIDSIIKTTDVKLARARFELDSQKQVVVQVKEKNSKDETQALDTEIARLEGSIKEMEQHSENLVMNYPSIATYPSFPWPPPRSSASMIIPYELLKVKNRKATLGDIKQKIVNVFDSCGYSEISYYRVQEDGFSVVTRLEQINRDGTPKKSPNRWVKGRIPLLDFSLKSYLNALFNANIGYYRVIVFVFTKDPFSQSEQTVNREKAELWLSEGATKLESSLAGLEYTEEYTCTALIYEFEQPAGKKPSLRTPSDIVGKEHLEKAKIWYALAKQ